MRTRLEKPDERNEQELPEELALRAIAGYRFLEAGGDLRLSGGSGGHTVRLWLGRDAPAGENRTRCAVAALFGFIVSPMLLIAVAVLVTLALLGSLVNA